MRGQRLIQVTIVKGKTTRDILYIKPSQLNDTIRKYQSRGLDVKYDPSYNCFLPREEEIDFGEYE